MSTSVEARTAPAGIHAAQGRERRLISLIVVPGVASLLLMVCSWAITRSRTTVFVVLVVLLALFVVQLVASLRLGQRVARAVGLAFSAALVFFAVFGVTYAEYADFARQEGIFSTHRLGEAFFLATTLGTGTGFAPDVGSKMGLLIIAHLQLVVLALGVALTAASAFGRVAMQRAKGTRYISEATRKQDGATSDETRSDSGDGDLPAPGPG